MAVEKRAITDYAIYMLDLRRNGITRLSTAAALPDRPFSSRMTASAAQCSTTTSSRAENGHKTARDRAGRICSVWPMTAVAVEAFASAMQNFK